MTPDGAKNIWGGLIVVSILGVIGAAAWAAIHYWPDISANATAFLASLT